MTDRSFSEAVGAALDTAMSADERVVLLVGNTGRARDPITNTLRQRYGNSRVIETEVANGGIVGAAFGMAVAGLRSVADIRLTDSSCHFHDQILEVSRIRYLSSHRFTAPMVIRISQGAGTVGEVHHLEIESTLAHIPGIKVVVPSNPRDAHDLLLAAIEDPDPVVFLEPIRLDPRMDSEVAHTSRPIDIGPVHREQKGETVTLFSWGGMMTETRQTARTLGEKGVSVEVIDIRTLSPLDRDGIAASVDRTGRAVVIHEGPLTAGFGSEIAATIQERCVYSLLAPVQRVAGWDTAVPLKRLEKTYRPSPDRIVAAVERTLG